MALGNLYIWTYTYYLIRRAGTKREAIVESDEECSRETNKDLESNEKSLLLNATEHKLEIKHDTWSQIWEILNQIGEELRTPPILAAVFGLVFGGVSWLHNLIIGENSPLKVIYDSIILLGDGSIPCITLILGGNLTQGLREAKVRSVEVIAVICVRYILLPAVGIFIVRTASHFGFLPSDPLYHFVLLIQYTLPPAMSISTMTQLFDVAQEESSVMFLWTYLAAAFAVTGWSTVFMWI